MATAQTRAKTSAPDMIRDRLRRAILDGQMPSGQQLRQDELAERFGTSRIPVREALRQLQAEGLVTLQPNRGAVVSILSLDEILEMLEIRVALECRALRLAIPNMDETDFAAIETILRDYDRAPRAEQWGDMNRRFHAALYAACGLPRLLAMIEVNIGQVGRFTHTLISRATGKESPQREHWALLEACRAGEVARAIKLLEAHIVQTQRAVKAAARRGDSRA